MNGLKSINASDARSVSNQHALMRFAKRCLGGDAWDTGAMKKCLLDSRCRNE